MHSARRHDALDLRPVSAADTDEACPVAIGHGGRAQQDVLKAAPSTILGICLSQGGSITRLCPSSITIPE